MICLGQDNKDTLLMTLVVMPQTTKKTGIFGAGLLKRLAACGNLFVQVGHLLLKSLDDLRFQGNVWALLGQYPKYIIYKYK